jgi:HEPN domain-containing protein
MLLDAFAEDWHANVLHMLLHVIFYRWATAVAHEAAHLAALAVLAGTFGPPKHASSGA